MSRWCTLTGAPPEVIAHRGASGERPEHTLAGYQLALDQGADVIEPDLVPSRDGVLFARHDPYLSRSTDVAARAGFADRRREGDWWSVDFDARELDGLRAVQPFRGRSDAHDRKHAIPRWDAIVEWAGEQAERRGRPVVLYPEIKHPAALAGAGRDPVPLFIAAVRALPPKVAVRVQCVEPEPLRAIHLATGLPCTLLLDERADWREAIDLHGAWLAALGVEKPLLWDRWGGESELVDVAHAAGLRVDAWTFRDDVLPEGVDGIEDELRLAMRTGIDGLFCDFPATALRVRAAIDSTGQAGEE